MKFIVALKKYLEEGTGKIPVSELMDFKKAITDADRENYSKTLEAHFGETIEP